MTYILGIECRFKEVCDGITLHDVMSEVSVIAALCHAIVWVGRNGSLREWLRTISSHQLGRYMASPIIDQKSNRVAPERRLNELSAVSGTVDAALQLPGAD